ncbi:MAG: Rpn family recombination-promoting nuclease/putative transposase, partial [Wolbachia sp.]
ITQEVCMTSTKLERSRMRRKVSRTVLKSSEEGRPSSLRQQYAEETTEEDLKEIAEKAPIIKLAYDELDKFRWNEKDLVAYEERIMDLRKEEAILEYKLDLAEEKGIEKGIEKGKIEVAKAMLANNVDVNTIVKFTGLSISEIEELSGNL